MQPKAQLHLRQQNNRTMARFGYHQPTRLIKKMNQGTDIENESHTECVVEDEKEHPLRINNATQTMSTNSFRISHEQKLLCVPSFTIFKKNGAFRRKQRLGEEQRAFDLVRVRNLQMNIDRMIHPLRAPVFENKDPRPLRVLKWPQECDSAGMKIK